MGGNRNKHRAQIFAYPRSLKISTLCNCSRPNVGGTPTCVLIQRPLPPWLPPPSHHLQTLHKPAVKNVAQALSETTDFSLCANVKRKEV